VDGSKSRENHLTFKPEINPKSARMLQNKRSEGELITRLYKEAAEIRTRREVQSFLKEQEEVKECTFVPSKIFKRK
jgi:hypothetical protein